MFAGISAGGVGLPFRFFTAYSNQPSQYVTAPAPAYDAYAIFDSGSMGGNFAQAPLTLSPGGDALFFDTGGIPYTLIPSVGRQQFSAREYSFAGMRWIPTLAADGMSQTYWINDSAPSITTVPAQIWYTGIAAANDIGIADADDSLSTLLLSASLPSGASLALHTYLLGLPGQYQRWRLEFSLAPGAGSASGNITDLTVTDVAGASSTAPSFTWTRGEGVQVPPDDTGLVSYAQGVIDLNTVGLVPTQATYVTSLVTPGNIVSMSPAYPAYVAPGTLILISVSNLQGMALPNVVGLTATAAASVLQQAQFTLSPALAPSFSDTVPAGLVMAQSPSAGTPAPSTIPIVLTVSFGPAPEFGTNLANYVGPPKTKATYASNYPRWMYHPTHQPIIVPDAFTEEALINYDPQWREKP